MTAPTSTRAVVLSDPSPGWPRRTPKVPRRKRKITSETVTPYLLVLPVLLILLVFRIYPLLLGINFSFTGDQELNGVFVGFDNYLFLLQDERFQASARNVLVVLLFVPLEVLVAGLLATFIFIKVPGHKFYRSVYFLPVVLSPIIIGAIFNIVLGANGPLNAMAESVGLPTVDYLGQTMTALPSVLTVHIWATFGMALVIFLAGFSTLDQQLLDAAKIDGANFPQTIWHVIIPGLSQTIQFVFVTTTIGMLTGLFGLLYTMTAGGPGAASYLPEFLIWKLNGEARPALASAASVFLLLIVLVIGLIQIRVLRRATKES
ncbi:carbohydrate ABC transporter permease [Agromyces mangrovi Wang et al. 2018]|uniref:carbohydrate ABC transporter permease n=1 Tax=Agromyces mangrovi TaxID=1858653 RepID=UPI002573BC4D|nr:sugar ABC transporter permease [Agromyces mangrovi]BDZ64076.1 sugar ABC transporter permease [Agromyces mangrovi]